MSNNYPQALSPVELDLQDIQGTVLRPRPIPYFGSYYVFTVDQADSALALLRRILPHITSAANWDAPAENAWINLTLSFEGLRKLGMPPQILNGFPREFMQGMAARHVYQIGRAHV